MIHLDYVIRFVEKKLAHYYGYIPLAAAENHLVPKSQITALIGEEAKFLDEWSSRASVWFIEPKSTNEDLFIGISINGDLCRILQNNNPMHFLNDKNIDAFCTLVEEISHFHLILNRAANQKNVTKIELEWQSEIDKLIICSMLLKQQSGDSHLLPLTRKLFDLGTIEPSTFKDRYTRASRYAAKFCFKVCRIGNLEDTNIREILIKTYNSSWQKKIELLERFDYQYSA